MLLGEDDLILLVTVQQEIITTKSDRKEQIQLRKRHGDVQIFRQGTVMIV